MPNDGVRGSNCAFLAEAAFLASDPRPAAALVASLRSLRPRAGELMVIYGSVGCLGPADRFVGLAAAAGATSITARSALESAVALCGRIGAPLWLATCLCDLAEPPVTERHWTRPAGSPTAATGPATAASPAQPARPLWGAEQWRRQGPHHGGGAVLHHAVDHRRQLRGGGRRSSDGSNR